MVQPCHVRASNARSHDNTQMAVSIPTIDISGIFSNPGVRADVGAQLVAAYREWGFSYIEGHPIGPQLMERVFAQSRAFHAQSLETKLDLQVDRSHRGYIPFKSSTDVTSSVDTVTKPNQSESFMMIGEIPDGYFLAGSDRWPDLPGFQETMQEYREVMTSLARSLIEVLAEALGDTGTLVDDFTQPTTWLRLLHYPPQDPQSPADEYGSAPHTDFGGITLLATEDVGGLSVRTPTGDWVDVPPKPDAFVMNVGDMLHRYSNGILRSTPHKVTNRTGRERYSVPFFFDPAIDATVAPLPACGEPEFEPLVFSDFLRGELEASYDNHKPTM